MNKYYTPTVEEIIPFILSEKYIHVVEYGESTKYYILHFQEDNIIDSIHQFIEMNDKDDKIYSINPEIYRVKYLDKEDINDLGFKEGKLPYQFFDGIHKLVYLGDNKISITHEADDCYLFYGVVKNKSELRKLLTQLGII